MSQNERVAQRRTQAEEREARVTVPAPAHPALGVSAVHEDLLGLQAAAGNRAVVSLLHAQASLAVGASDDPHELEADAVARQVVAQLSQSGSAPVSDVSPVPEEEEGLARMIRRRAEVGEAPIGAEGGQVGAELERDLQSARSGGAPLPSTTRSRMEGAFGVDFGNVRVHEGPRSGELNRKLGATAFTVGRDIFFGGATSSPTEHLLAHELTHVVQQGAAGSLR
jgi:hypothetical protein